MTKSEESISGRENLHRGLFFPLRKKEIKIQSCFFLRFSIITTLLID